MKIGIDIRTMCVTEKAGKGWYTHHLVHELLKLDRKNQYLLYANSQAGLPSMPGNAEVKIFEKHAAVWHLAVARDVVRERCDLFFAPTSFIIPAILPSSVKSVVTVHDAVSFLFPREHQTKAVLVENFFARRALKKAACVLVPSENTKKDLAAKFGFLKGKIEVTPLGCSEVFSALSSAPHPFLHAFEVHEKFMNSKQRKEGEIRKKWNLPEKFVLAVGTLEPRKNLEVLIRTVHSLNSVHDPAKRGMNSPMKMKLKVVMVGMKGWKSVKLSRLMQTMKNEVVLLPYLPEEELAALYQLATVFVFPSLYEGFGIPPLEAMASGCPVICSNAASLPEVVGSAALLFDPHDEKMLLSHLERVLINAELRDELSRRGLEQAKKFDWQKTAERTLAVFNQD